MNGHGNVGLIFALITRNCSQPWTMPLISPRQGALYHQHPGLKLETVRPGQATPGLRGTHLAQLGSTNTS